MTSHEIILQQKERLLSALTEVVPAGRSYALLDFPDYSNVGDSAIWLGALHLLRSVTSRDPAYVCRISDFDEAAFRRAVPTGAILLQGGGNFGDLYGRHQRFREGIIERFPDRPIIQMPQSIQYRDVSQIERTARVIDKQRNFHLFVRDENSLALARRHFSCPVYLAPDCAMALGALGRDGAAEADVLPLLRTDFEGVQREEAAFGELPSRIRADWVGAEQPFRNRVRARTVTRSLLSGRWSRGSRQVIHFEELAKWRLRRGIRLLSSANYVITDRLHAHLLSLLLDIPHVALDNDYGKVQAYIAAWTSEAQTVATASNAEEAVARLRELKARHAAAAAAPQPGDPPRVRRAAHGG